MFRRIFSSLTALTLMLLCLVTASPVSAQMGYGSGVYTNLCGSGTAANSHACSGECNPGSGSCTGNGNHRVVRFVCDGRTTDCRSNESAFSTSQSLGNPGCGKTVQLDVFEKACRNSNGGWDCTDGQMTDYMVWYSGDCPAPTAPPTKKPTPRPTTTPTAPPIPHESSCDSLQVVSGDNQTIPATVTLRAAGSDNKGSIQMYRFRFGDGKRVETTEREVTHKYEVSGRIRPAVEIKDSQGQWVSSRSCETSLTLKSTPVESFKSGCSDLVIVRGNRKRAPSTVEFRVSGYDNKGDIDRYKIDLGNGVTKENDGPTFEQIYDQAGTYTIKGYVRDSKGDWHGGDDECRTTLYVETKPLTEQPKTGTPTSLAVAAVTSGAVGTVALFRRASLLKTKRRR